MAKAPDEKLLRRIRILVAPLDWGLGHASRSIPVIKELLANNCEVWLAGTGEQEALLRSEFPQLSFLGLEGYRIRYAKTGFAWKIILQIPKIITAIRKEHEWLKKMVAEHNFNAVISDNRFGLYHQKIPTVFITHQLTIKTKVGKWSEIILRRGNYRYINRFTECWVPDTEGRNNIGGELSHPPIQPNIPVKYIGLLSRFHGQTENTLVSPGRKSKDHLLFILSGPEPQRTILEDRIINDVSHYAGTATIVRGLPTSLMTLPSTSMLRFYNHLSIEDFKAEFEKAEWVISRGGYSTVMDLVRLQKKAILIPTPGQTEQEYLAKYLEQKQIAATMEQQDFSLPVILDRVKRFNYQIPVFDSEQELKIVVRNFLSNLKV